MKIDKQTLEGKNVHVISTNHNWTEFVSDELKDKLYVLDKLEEQESRIKEMKDAAADIGLKWHDYDAGEDAWEDEHKGRWLKA